MPFPSRALALAFGLAGLVATSACGPNVHSATVRGIGYVRMDAVVKHHPLYGQLKQLDDAIAAINLAAAAPHKPLTAAQIAAQTAILRREMADAQARTGKILAQKQADYSKREGEAVAAALVAAKVPGAGRFAAAQMSQASAAQARSAMQAAGKDFMDYQQSVIAQGNAAGAAVARQLQEQAGQKIRAKASQLQQNETDLSLQLSQQSAATRLSLKMRLGNLALDTATRKKLQDQLAAIHANDAKILAAQQQRDRATLAAYQTKVEGQTRAAIASALATINAQTRSKIESERNQVGAQIRSLGPPSLPPNLPSGVKATIAQLQQQYTAQFRADAQSTIAQYEATSSDLERQFAALHGADVGATGKAAAELASLQAQRADLYDKMLAQIRSEADRIAKAQGFSTVFTNITAAAGGYDMTNELIKDVEGLHE